MLLIDAVEQIHFLRLMVITLAVSLCLPILRHKDDWTSIGGLRGKQQIQEDKWIRIPVSQKGKQVDQHSNPDDGALGDDEAPGSHAGGDSIRDALP